MTKAPEHFYAPLVPSQRPFETHFSVVPFLQFCLAVTKLSVWNGEDEVIFAGIRGTRGGVKNDGWVYPIVSAWFCGTMTVVAEL